MRQEEWKLFLAQWSRDLLACPEIADKLPASARTSSWLGYPPATEQQIRRAETRLGIVLPNSYREFLKVTNGWRISGFFVEKLLPVQEIDWYATKYPELLEAWLYGSRLGKEEYGDRPITDEEYFVYGPEQQSAFVRVEYLEAALAISEYSDGIYLLNPKVVTPEGEWEAWFLAPWLPGAIRYRSFWELMQGEAQSFLELRDRRGT